MRRFYQEWNPGEFALSVVRITNEICAEMKAQGYDLTLRQLYYQFVARGYLPNKQREYKRLGDIVNRGRLSGRIDWAFIEDRTRNLASWAAYNSPGDLIRRNQYQYGVDHWIDQDVRIEVWVEKEALVGVVGRTAGRWRVPYFACRGYVSQSELHSAAQRHIRHENGGQDVVVLHLGDHDPSGIDMTRDIEERLELFGASTTVKRLALNMDQVEQYNPPPNPAKTTDSRAGGYIREYGRQSWELDALSPATIDAIIDTAIAERVDLAEFEARAEVERLGQDQLGKTADNWAAVEEFVEAL
ncbi:hypothetical protein ACFWGP_05535 [Agromyces sp. NPDC127015]|uniref:hypothetical protein n=1 Tax=Agromyces sp. NPDC127015 TaxID=3347108 RepID=UPI003666FBD5